MLNLANYRKRATENWPTSHDVHDLCDEIERLREKNTKLHFENVRLRHFKAGVKLLCNKYSLFGKVPCDDLDDLLDPED